MIYVQNANPEEFKHVASNFIRLPLFSILFLSRALSRALSETGSIKLTTKLATKISIASFSPTSSWPPLCRAYPIILSPKSSCPTRMENLADRARKAIPPARHALLRILFSNMHLFSENLFCYAFSGF